MTPDDKTTLDHFLGGALALRQPTSGHRSGTDAILLAATVGGASGSLIDLGAGVGAAGLAVAAKLPGVNVTLVEIDPVLADIATDNIARNGLGGRVRAVACDALSAAARRTASLDDATADVVISNPPWLTPGRARISPDARRALAHVARADDGAAGWLRAAAALLRPDGRMAMIHRADALAELLAGCAGRFGDLSVLPVHPRADAPAIRLIVAGRKGSRAPTRLLPGLALHDADGAFTPRAEALMRGAARLDLV
jgi:tRNA1(Val) A37 N6-methylase TrmN6